ncbi:MULTISPECIES: hypothetical protein [Stappiaceae]|jgi:hypothetical protein|uniref:DUF7007 domain-containing protein n=1 Tax=Stappiaceae TaxID=2821832 RepID=UPI001ADD3973|nr:MULTISPECIES: hypothetical protein [Stappiaceae]MBO9463333.1 hypothetical protein [Labrenzia sp. R5_0]
MSFPQSELDRAAAPEVRFAISAEGFPVAQVGDTAFAMLPGRGDIYFLATAWCVRRPPDELVRNDFYGHGGVLGGEEAFRAKVLEQDEHAREKRALGRREIHCNADTPWGPSQGATVYAEGVVCHSTAGHGGFHLSSDRNAKVERRLRRPGGWYEEDAEWAIVALTLPHLFTSFERRSAERTVKDAWPDAWEAIFCTVLEPGQSHEKDRRTFHARHADDWIVISAIRSEQQDGFVEVIATLGGMRGQDAEQRRFLVPAAEYKIGRFGFVVDPARHDAYDGPSSFIGWRPSSQ